MIDDNQLVQQLKCQIENSIAGNESKEHLVKQLLKTMQENEQLAAQNVTSKGTTDDDIMLHSTFEPKPVTTKQNRTLIQYKLVVLLIRYVTCVFHAVRDPDDRIVAYDNMLFCYYYY